jgi:hypothetical protein
MARSASVGVERSTKAYPTGRSVRGFLGIEVDSLGEGLLAAVDRSFESSNFAENANPMDFLPVNCRTNCFLIVD